MAIKDELDFIYEYTLTLAYAEGWGDRDAHDIARDARAVELSRIFREYAGSLSTRTSTGYISFSKASAC